MCPCRHLRPSRGFTLVEFILVMALLAVVMAVAAPRLSQFFRGRELEAEARRFLALTRYGQSQAVSAGLPMILWIDREANSYGLHAQDEYLLTDLSLQSSQSRSRDGYEAVDVKRPAFRLAESLRFELEILSRTNSRIVSIRFLPDGTIDDASLRVLQIVQPDRKNPSVAEPIWIAQSRNRSRYEIVDSTNAWARLQTEMGAPGGFYVR